jgi:hypothetical protein
MSIYVSGTVTVLNGGISVTSSRTVFLSQAAPGDLFVLGGFTGVVDSVISNTELQLRHPWEGADAIDIDDYAIVHTGNKWHSNVTVNETLTEIIRRINAGIGFKPDASGSLAERSNFDSASKGFLFMQTNSDPFKLYVKNSAAPGDWSDGTSFTGPQGPPGTIGPTGLPGPATNITIGSVTAGEAAAAEIVGTAPNLIMNLTLPLGPRGLPGEQGEVGPPVSVEIGTVTHGEIAEAEAIQDGNVVTINLTLPRGETGIGEEGPPGPPNVLTIGSVEAGEPGADPEISITGTAPNQQINFVIPRGYEGPEGQPGEEGPPGPPTSLSVGTVATGAPGSQAQITIRGTAPNQLIDFTIPQGPQGQQGIQGPSGRLAEFRGDPTSGTIQWRLQGDPTWATLVSFGDVQAASHNHPDLEAKIASIPDPIAMAMIFSA